MMHDIERDRSLTITGKIDEDTRQNTIAIVSELIERDSEKWIHLFINSAGGDVLAGFMLYEMMRHIFKPNIQTIALGSVKSMAVIVYLAGEHRAIGKHATLFLHDLSLSVDTKGEANFDLSKMKSIVNDMEKSRETYINIIMERIGNKLSAQDISNMMATGTILDAQDAVQMGFAHEILGDDAAGE